MKNLKTLNEIQVPYPYFNGDEGILRDLIKKEAINWVKFGDELIAFEHEKEKKVVINWIKHFFNITEEELKNG